MTIYLVRHGETDWNRTLRFQGREDIPLNAAGLAQAEACGRALAGRGITAVYASPLRRAAVTGEVIAQALGLAPPVRLLPALIERDLGEYSGCFLRDRAEYFRLAAGQDAAGMEPFEAVRRRMRAALAEIAASGCPAAAAVSHGAAINVLLADLSGGAAGTGKTRLCNGAVSILEGDAAGFRIAACALPPETLAALPRG